MLILNILYFIILTENVFSTRYVQILSEVIAVNVVLVMPAVEGLARILTSVLLKRGGTASPEVVARARAKRDSLKAAEMRARKPAKARPEE